ncbi:glycosyltransferase [Aestuariibacter halophilus]|uniref:Glycosyltransferase n=1 Tax=Fluctibacter halophilus TaxID=226011 RepID=A0ABS8GAX7_9ALTE|nr:glycosyltransferase [Aestuariibacter halophilus]MCC2617226.1 glycosyltransferase [Aestuariibacter halophilus]
MKVCIFTIVSNNYLHYANTLFESVREHCPQADLVLGLCDKKTEKTFCPEAEIIEMCDLPIEDIGRFIYQYSILELNTAIKPYVIEELMKRGYDAVIYLDPDIKVFGTLDPMLALLQEHNVLLTPHLTNLLDDGKLPDELGILQAGSYNLGYIGLANNTETMKLVKWWQRKLYKECVVDISRGLFVDQKWMDMVPSLFDGVYICRDEGWNVAYWNLNHRDVVEKQNEFFVNGQPLMFFHFSGYSIEAKTLSKHQNRFAKADKGPALVKLCEIYNECLLKHGIDEFKSIPYAFSQFADGTNVPDASRRLIKDDPAFDAIDFFDPKDCQKVHDFLNQCVGGRSSNAIGISRLAHALWSSRDDLKNAFPDVLGADSTSFVEWLCHAAPKEANFADVYIEGMRKDLETWRDKNASQNTDYNSSLFSGLIRFAWSHRQLLPLSLRLKLGAGVANWAFKKAYSAPQQALHVEGAEYGLNLIGYVHAESGVGEAARSSIRGINSAQIPHCIVDYRVGNISRMGEVVDGNLVDEMLYGVNLIHVNADQSKIVRESLGENKFSDKYNIGYWYWELPEFPEMFDFAFDQVDEIWVATTYTQHALEQKTSKPVRLIRPNVSVDIDSDIDLSAFSLPNEAFTFFHMSDVLSMHQRKNPLGVINAFTRAFQGKPEENVRLLLKISNLERQPELQKAVRAAIAKDTRIELIEGYLDRPTLNAILFNIDCYVSLHRAEGFGLPIAEAMCLGKPVIATMWSGNADFMTEANSLPIKFELTTLETTIGPYEKGQVWAEPCLDDAADKMINIANNRAIANALGEQAAKDIAEQYSPKASGEAIKARLNEILGQ